MTIEWNPTEKLIPIGLTPKMENSAAGPILGFQRNLPNGARFEIIAEADGPARASVFAPHPGPNTCYLEVQALRDDNVIYAVFGDDGEQDWTLSPRKGAFGGSIDDLHPHVLASYKDSSSDGWYCSATRVYRLTGPFEFYAYDWNMNNKTFITSEAKDPEQLQLSQALPAGDSFFWTTGNLYVSGINSWNFADGARPFIRYIGDGTRGAGNLGTDGTSLVWSYAEGKKPSETAYPVRAIMTAPFTTDPAKLASKRLRSDPSNSIAGQPFHVACGRAAHGGKLQPVVVVNVKDGTSWEIPEQPNPNFYLSTVIGLSCDHVYLLGAFGQRYNIARIRLDSLGPALPPD